MIDDRRRTLRAGGRFPGGDRLRAEAVERTIQRRVRVLQENLFANARPLRGRRTRPWRAELSANYREPSPKISYRGAFSHQFRRVYLPLITAMLVGWLVHIWAFSSDETFLESAALPGIDGVAVVAAVAVYYGALLVMAVSLSSKERGESGGADHGGLE